MRKTTPYSVIRGIMCTLVMLFLVFLFAMLSPIILGLCIVASVVGLLAYSTWAEFRNAAGSVVGGAWDEIRNDFRTWRKSWTERID